MISIYGGSSAAVTAAYPAAQMGKKVLVVSPDDRIGGLTTGGLGVMTSDPSELPLRTDALLLVKQ